MFFQHKHYILDLNIRIAPAMSTQKQLKENLSELLAKEMDRKDFLKHVGIAVVALTGVAGIINVLSNQRITGLGQSNVSHGYGTMPYGGKKN